MNPEDPTIQNSNPDLHVYRQYPQRYAALIRAIGIGLISGLLIYSLFRGLVIAGIVGAFGVLYGLFTIKTSVAQRAFRQFAKKHRGKSFSLPGVLPAMSFVVNSIEVSASCQHSAGGVPEMLIFQCFSLSQTDTNFIVSPRDHLSRLCRDLQVRPAPVSHAAFCAAFAVKPDSRSVAFLPSEVLAALVSLGEFNPGLEVMHGNVTLRLFPFPKTSEEWSRVLTRCESILRSLSHPRPGTSQAA